jgi:hypothetical protein
VSAGANPANDGIINDGGQALELPRLDRIFVGRCKTEIITVETD